jgi:lipopolysaccharide biosynthesis glycosyltransferase
VKKQNGKALPVVFALHDANGEYWLNAAVAMTSAGVHASAPLHFHVLHNETLHIPAKERLLAVAQSLGHEISFHFVTLPGALNEIDLHRFSPASLYRLMIPQLFAHEEAVVYLDADLVCHGIDVHMLVQLTPPNKAMGGVIDPHITKPAEHQRALAALQINANQYINSGVLVIRPPLIRDDLLIAFKLFYQRHPNALHPDQDFLNLILSSRIERLPDCFNAQVGVYEHSLFQSLASYNNKIIHYAGKLKPLDGNLAPAFLVFWMYAMLVPEIAHLNPNMRYVRPMKDAPNCIVREPATRDV